jgi:hypothetical protein
MTSSSGHQSKLPSLDVIAKSAKKNHIKVQKKKSTVGAIKTAK